MKRTRIYWGFGIACGVALLVWLMLAVSALERVEWITYDYRMKLARSETPLHPDVAVVLIDEASLQALNPLVGRWPWPRSIFADLMEFLALGGARAVVFDILFAENELTGGADELNKKLNDRRLIRASADTDIAYHAVQIIQEEADEGTAGDLGRKLPVEFTERFALTGKGIPDRANNSYVLPLPELYQSSRGIGVVNVDADSDSVYRRVNLFSVYQNGLYPGLSLAPLIEWLNPHEIRFQKDLVRIGELAVPVDANGHYLVNMAGKPRPYSASGILSSIQKLRSGDIEDLLVFPDEFQDKIVFVGASAVGLQDIKTTPISAKTPGVFIHASVASNFLSKDFLRPVGSLGTLLIVGVLALVTVASILGTARWYYQLVFPSLLAFAYLGLSVGAFEKGIVQPVAAPMAAIVLSWLAASTYLMLTEGRDRRRVRDMFARYVSPAVLSEVVDRYSNQMTGVGHREHLSILFSDIRGFTSFSERLPAEKVVELLNIHFSVMTEIIFRHTGTLDKFIGDAMMAFWGAPVRTEDHARLAVSAALEMVQAIKQVNQQLKARDLPPISIGIGINTGDVVLGNIGSEHKLDYTVIGDHVNLASRLEGLTKYYQCPVLISEYTRSELGADFPCVLVDTVRVKGKQQPIRLYWPLGLPSSNNGGGGGEGDWRGIADLAEAAYEAYRQCQWEEAEALYDRLPNQALGEIFIARCQQFRSSPPAAGWDGVHTLETK